MIIGKCYRYEMIGEAFSKTIEKIIKGENEDYSILINMCIRLEEQLEAREIDLPCLRCDDCWTFLENRKIVYGHLFYGEDQQWVIEQKQYVKKARVREKILQNVAQLSPEDFNRSPYSPNTHPLVYLDHNVMDKIHKEEAKRRKLVPGYADIQYIYSPSHLQEVNRMNNKEEEDKVLSTIREVTKSLFVSNFEGSKLSLAYEDPEYGMRRVAKSVRVALNVEEYRVITANDRKFFYPERTDQAYTRELTYEYVFSHESVFAVTEQFPSEEIIDKNGRVKHFQFVHQAIYALIRALDDLGYKTDKTDRARKSSAHDIEHLIYAAGSDIFVTIDQKFRDRSKLIYKRLGFDTIVMDWNEYADYVDSVSNNKR